MKLNITLLLLLPLLFTAGCERQPAPEHQMDCVQVGRAGRDLFRCSNEEAVCYTHEQGIACAAIIKMIDDE